MTLFWILVAVMLLVAVGLLVPPLFGRRALADQDRRAQNVAIARERLQELEAEHAAGNLDQATLEQARRELELALADDVADAADTPAGGPGRSPAMLAAIVLLVPALAIGLYWMLGNPDAINPQAAADPLAEGHGGQQMTLPEMAARLEQKLEEQPDNAQGWYLLGRTYMQMRRYGEAAKAFEKLHGLVGDEPGVLLPWADALAMQQGGKVSGKAFELVQRVLESNPHEPTALWLAGMGYEQAGDHEQAVRHWKRLLPQLQGDPEAQKEVQALIAKAEKALGHTVEVDAAQVAKAPAAGGARLSVTVDLDPALRDQVSPEDTVFVFARALNGPPMPLAVVRKQVKDLPITVTLDDSMAMMPQMKLSAFPQVRIEARISKSGQATPRSGDLKGEVSPVSPGQQDSVEVRIDQRIP